MNYGGKYWNIKDYIPYQRCFNLINSERTIGKTYTAQGFFIERALNKGEEFVYIVRTQDEKNKGVFEKAFAKVIQKEFGDKSFEFTKDECWLRIEDEGENLIEKVPLGYCIALSEATKSKKLNFPNVKWFMFDEYIVDEKEKSAYVNGWNEPDLLLKIYHTIDRERDYVVCFLLANNISFYNPYHMHKAFNIPHVPKGKIWYNENVLFHWTQGSDALKEDKAKCKFLKMIDSTDYGSYAKEGKYVNDVTSLIKPRSNAAKYMLTLEYDGNKFAVWHDSIIGLIFIDTKVDNSYPLKYALSLKDHNESTVFIKSDKGLLKWLSQAFKRGYVRYANMSVKARAEEAIKLIL